MPTQHMTDPWVAALVVEERTEFYDELQPGLILRVGAGPGVSKTWYVRYRKPPWRRRRLRLGAYPTIKLGAAREETRQALRRLNALADSASEGLARLRKRRKVGRQIYFIRSLGGPIDRTKIGISTDPRSRLVSLQSGSSLPLEVIGSFPGDEQDEKLIHAKFSSLRLHGEWFRTTGDVLMAAKCHSAAEVLMLRPRAEAPDAYLDTLVTEAQLRWTVSARAQDGRTWPGPHSSRGGGFPSIEYEFRGRVVRLVRFGAAVDFLRYFGYEVELTGKVSPARCLVNKPPPRIRIQTALPP